MSGITSRKKFYLIMFIFITYILALSIISLGDEGHKQITLELIDLAKKNPEIGKMLETSIAEAKEKNPDPKTNPVQNLSEYYNFIDSASDLIPQDVLKNPSTLTRDQILQSIYYFISLLTNLCPN